MQLSYRTKEQLIEDFAEQTGWLDSSLDIPTEEIGEFFSKRTEGYDKVMMDYWEDYKTIPDFLPTQFETMLNLGCGCGFEFEVISKKYPDIQVVGIDKSKAMLDAFRQRPFFNKDNFKLIEADYFEYPFEKNQYDVVMSAESLHHYKFEKKKEIYKKIYDATKQDGYYYELDFMSVNNDFEKLNLDYYEKRREKYNVPEDVFVHIDIPLSLEHQIELLKYAGFKKIELLNKPFLKSYTVFLKASK
ncbi:MAG: class I SAM-dependent methyltransferase [Clostridiales bacterium]|nr:class I SAM-dependent methyltransferase [Clostridiales bacterium]